MEVLRTPRQTTTSNGHGHRRRIASSDDGKLQNHSSNGGSSNGKENNNQQVSFATQNRGGILGSNSWDHHAAFPPPLKGAPFTRCNTGGDAKPKKTKSNNRGHRRFISAPPTLTTTSYVPSPSVDIDIVTSRLSHTGNTTLLGDSMANLMYGDEPTFDLQQVPMPSLLWSTSLSSLLPNNNATTTSPTPPPTAAASVQSTTKPTRPTEPFNFDSILDQPWSSSSLLSADSITATNTAAATEPVVKPSHRRTRRRRNKVGNLKVKFQKEEDDKQKNVILIPHHDNYPRDIKSDLWDPPQLQQANIVRNTMEFASEGNKPAKVFEENKHFLCPIQHKLIHPVHVRLLSASLDAMFGIKKQQKNKRR